MAHDRSDSMGDINQERGEIPYARQPLSSHAMPGQALRNASVDDLADLPNFRRTSTFNRRSDSFDRRSLSHFDRSDTFRTDASFMTARTDLSNGYDESIEAAAEIVRLKDELKDLKTEHNIALHAKDASSERAKGVLEQEQKDAITKLTDNFAEEIERRDSDFMKVSKDQAELGADVARLKAALAGVTQTAKALRQADHNRSERGDDDTAASQAEVQELRSEVEERKAEFARELAEKDAEETRDRESREEELRDKVEKLRAILAKDIEDRNAQIQKASIDAAQLSRETELLSKELKEVEARCEVTQNSAEYVAESSAGTISELRTETRMKLQDVESSTKEKKEKAKHEIEELVSDMQQRSRLLAEESSFGEEAAIKEKLASEMESLPEKHEENWMNQREEEERIRQELEQQFTEKIEELHQAHAEAMERRGVAQEKDASMSSETHAEMASLHEEFREKARATARKSTVKAKQDLEELKSQLQAQQAAAEIAAQEAASKAAALAAGIGVMNSSESVLQQLKNAEALGASTGERRCPSGCGYLVTWHATHCCNQCQLKPGKHGPRCSRLTAGRSGSMSARSGSMSARSDGSSPTRSNSQSSLGGSTPIRTRGKI